jgi:hypothetical protein
MVWPACPAAVSGRDSARSAAEPRIRPGDGLFVTVTPCDNCTRYLRVTPEGRIRVPLAGTVAVGDNTTTAAAAAVRQAFVKQGQDPVVRLRLIRDGTPAESAGKSAMVFLFGAHLTVPLPYEEKMTLEDALKSDRDARSTEAPAPARIVIAHTDSSKATVDWKPGAGAAILLKPGDTIWVSFPRRSPPLRPPPLTNEDSVICEGILRPPAAGSRCAPPQRPPVP